MTEIHRPRVLLLTATLGYGGSESTFLRLADYIARHAEVTVALMARDYDSPHYTNAQSHSDLPIVILDEGRSNGHGLVAKVLRWGRMLRSLKDIKSSQDITISFLSGPNLLNALSGRPKGMIVSERGSKLHHTGITPFTKFIWLRVFDPFIYRRAGKIVPASVGYAREIAEIAGKRHAHKIFPIEGGIDAAKLIAATDEEPDADIARFCKGPTAVYCGRLDRGKGIDLLLASFAQVRNEQPQARLLLLGDGPLRERIIQCCQTLGMSVTSDGDASAAVFMAGYRSDPARHFKLCTVFLLPSLHEGLSNSLIEGVSSGIPVLGANCPWGPCSVLSGRANATYGDFTDLPTELPYGTLMPIPNNAGAQQIWKQKIAQALQQPMPHKSREVRLGAIRRFDIEVTGTKWLELINDATTS